MTPEERADFDFLLSRSGMMGGYHSGDGDRWWGVSSNAMVEYSFGGLFPDDFTYPRDRSDLAACYRAARRLPKHHRPRVRMILNLYRARMAEHDCQWRKAA